MVARVEWETEPSLDNTTVDVAVVICCEMSEGEFSPKETGSVGSAKWGIADDKDF